MTNSASNTTALDLQQLYNELYPLCRSITGFGYRQSLEIIQRYIPLQIEEFTSGSTVCNWTVPPEWLLHRATLKDIAGHVILDTDINPMCLLNYAESFHGKVSRQELESHFFTLDNQPNVTPYVTSYYKRKWGFCLNAWQKASLQDDYYQVDIDTEYKTDGAVLVGSCDLKGKSDKIIFISSYLCHPCMLNNELSGPIALIYLYYLLSAVPERQYTYRFILNPETIGSICYLSRHATELKEKLVFGFVINTLASQYKTGHGVSPIKTVDPQAIITRLEQQAPSNTASSTTDATSLAASFFSALHEELNASISCNFLPTPLIFKLSRQSLMDEFTAALPLQQHSQANTGTSSDNASSDLQQRYYHEYDFAKINGTENTQEPSQALDAVRMQQQMKSLHNRAHPLQSFPDAWAQLKIPASTYSYGIDRFLTSWQENSPDEVALLPFSPLVGSDERQYCSALMNLPVVSISRTMAGFDKYASYHTQADNQQEFSLDSVVDSALKIFDVLQAYSIHQQYVTAQYIGEPQLGKYNLYPSINNFNVGIKRMASRYSNISLPNILSLLNFANGTLSIWELAKILKISLYELMDLLRTLESKHLIAYQATKTPILATLAQTAQTHGSLACSGA